jgi:hypothetical protein
MEFPAVVIPFGDTDPVVDDPLAESPSPPGGWALTSKYPPGMELPPTDPRRIAGVELVIGVYLNAGWPSPRQRSTLLCGVKLAVCVA